MTMFTHSHEEHSVVTPSRPVALHEGLKRSVVWCCSAGLAVAIVGALALVVSQVVFGREPIGGDSGLVLLYLATAVAGIGLAVLGRILPTARRAPRFAVASPFPNEVSPPPRARTSAREAA
jgi:hypothetical protein